MIGQLTKDLASLGEDGPHGPLDLRREARGEWRDDDALTALSDLERMVAGLLEAGHSQHIAAYSLRIIKSALKQAVRWQLVARNAAEAIRPPRVPKNELTVWTRAEAKRFLEVTSAHRLHGLFVLALLTGMRRGELLGLHWDDVDFERTRLTVRRNLVYTPGLLELSKPKTAGSHRTVSLSPGVIEALHHHRQRQTLEREALGAAYGDCGLVFASEVGTPTHPRNLERVFFGHLESSGVRRIRFHDLRHTAASLMILRGVPPKLVSKLLGHASVAFTLQVYVHVFEEQETGATLDLSDLD